MTHTQFLSSSFQLKGQQIKNRIVVPPMADFGATDPEGLVNSRHLKRYAEFAAGGAGLIIIEACTVCRVRLLSELIQEIRQQCGTDFIIAVRFGNHSTDELIATGKIIEDAGGDILDISSGMGAYQKPEDFLFDSKIFAASCVKKEVSLPVICVIPHGAIKFCMAKNQQNVYIAEIVCGI